MIRDEDRARQEFTSEAEELLDVLAGDLAEFESQGSSVRPELVNKIFREVHSLKGLAGMLGFSEIAELSHNLEDMLDRLRMGRVSISRDLHDLLFDALDGLSRLVVGINNPSGMASVDTTRLSSRIHQLVSQQRQNESSNLLDRLELDEQTRKSLTEYEEHRLRENIRLENQVWSIEMTFDFSDFDERLRAVTARLTEQGEVISTLPAIDSSGGGGISFRLLYGTRLDEAAVRALTGETALVRSLRRSQTPSVAAPVLEVPVEPSADEEVSLRSLSRTVRVDISRLDHVMNIVGELIIVKTHLEALIRQTQANDILVHELTKLSRNLDRKLNDLQKSVIEIRMIPVGQIYAKLSRAVRKIAREVGKEIELVLRGEDTELDKMMVEELTDPLMHIIRNAIDHGIESPEARVAAGKSPTGRVILEAYQKGNSVVLDVMDDGKGIDPESVRRVAVTRGILQAEETVDLARACELIFAPGLSTAATLSEISGRGVGLDVVRKNILELKGSIEVLSDPGRGTTFRVTLPITLAILQALIVQCGEERFAIPLTSVEESLRIRASEIATVERKEVCTLRDFTLPLLRLSDAFGVREIRDTSSPDAKWFVVVTRAGERSVGIIVDSLIRQQEIVIKSIGDRLKAIPGIAGATELGESEIILVVDTGSLIEHFGGAARASRRSVAG